MAQMSINRLLLPEELLIIIKDYTFPSIERKHIMQIHTQIQLKVNKTINRTTQPNRMPNQWFYWDNYLCMFCTCCGNYKSRKYPIHNYNLIKCKC